MKRTPPWVFVAAVGVQLAGLGLCLWAMDLVRRADDASAEAAEAVAATTEEPALQRNALAPAPEVIAAEALFARTVVRAIDLPPWAEPAPHTNAAPVRVQPPPPPAAPLFGPPPARPSETAPGPEGIPPFITEAADETSQIVRGRAAEGPFAFGFYPDGNIRFVDVDGGRYAGKAESARARMREVDGMRAFTVQIGVAADFQLQATFTGGPHDAQTIPLEPLAGWSTA